MSSALDIERKLRALEREVARLRSLEYLPLTDTYTPTYVGGSTAGVTTYTSQVGVYARVGGLVIASITVGWSAATGTGDARISLPFTASTTFNQNYPVSLRLNAVTWTGSVFQGLILPATDYFIIQGVSSNAAPTTSAVEAAGAIIAVAAYLVD